MATNAIAGTQPRIEQVFFRGNKHVEAEFTFIRNVLTGLGLAENAASNGFTVKSESKTPWQVISVNVNKENVGASFSFLVGFGEDAPVFCLEARRDEIGIRADDKLLEKGPTRDFLNDVSRTIAEKTNRPVPVRSIQKVFASPSGD